jgi:hypothetical protein
MLADVCCASSTPTAAADHHHAVSTDALRSEILDHALGRHERLRPGHARWRGCSALVGRVEPLPKIVRREDRRIFCPLAVASRQAGDRNIRIKR